MLSLARRRPRLHPRHTRTIWLSSPISYSDKRLDRVTIETKAEAQPSRTTPPDDFNAFVSQFRSSPPITPKLDIARTLITDLKLVPWDGMGVLVY